MIIALFVSCRRSLLSTAANLHFRNDAFSVLLAQMVEGLEGIWYIYDLYLVVIILAQWAKTLYSMMSVRVVLLVTF